MFVPASASLLICCALVVRILHRWVGKLWAFGAASLRARWSMFSLYSTAAAWAGPELADRSTESAMADWFQCCCWLIFRPGFNLNIFSPGPGKTLPEYMSVIAGNFED
jgi:hypothetical protein